MILLEQVRVSFVHSIFNWNKKWHLAFQFCIYRFVSSYLKAKIKNWNKNVHTLTIHILNSALSKTFFHFYVSIFKGDLFGKKSWKKPLSGMIWKANWREGRNQKIIWEIKTTNFGNQKPFEKSNGQILKIKKPFKKSKGQILEIKKTIREIKRTNFGNQRDHSRNQTDKFWNGQDKNQNI